MMSQNSVPRRRGRMPRKSKSPLVLLEKLEMSSLFEGGINIGTERDRWLHLKAHQRLTNDEEMAKALLDVWEREKENSLNIGQATLKDFCSFQEKTHRSADELIRFYLRLGIEPGQAVLVLSDKVQKQLESLKGQLKLGTDDTLKYLIKLHDGCSSDSTSESSKGMCSLAAINESVRLAVRAEISQLYSGGVLPGIEHKIKQSGENDSTEDTLKDGKSELKRTQARKLPLELCATLVPKDSLKAESSSQPPLSIQLDINDDTVEMDYKYVMDTNQLDVPPGNINPGRRETTPAATVLMSEDKQEGVSFSSSSSQTQSKKRLKCSHCNYKCSMLKDMNRHMNQHTGLPFKCSLCSMGFIDKFLLHEHFTIKHKKQIHFDCGHCNKTFISRLGLKLHMKTIHKKDFMYYCLDCVLGFNHETSFHDHNMKSHKLQHCKCSSCSKVIDILTRVSMQKNKEGKRKAKQGTNFKHVCEICCIALPSKKNHRDHMLTRHGQSQSFSGDRKQISHGSLYDPHKKMTTDASVGRDTSDNRIQQEADGLKNVEIINVESLCDDSQSKNEQGIIELVDDSIQITNIESGEQFYCDLKSETVTNETPAEETDVYKCQQCSYTTLRTSHMNRHAQTHIIKQYPCPFTPQCTKSFDEQNKLQSHLANKHKSKPRYGCDKCSRIFCSKGGLMYHEQTKHNNTYKYRCETCDKGFNTYQHYVGHKNTHSGFRPYICERCNLGFAYPSVLASHKRVCKGRSSSHNGQLDLFPCSQCKEKFASVSGLQDHVQDEHSSMIENSFLCECGAEFQLKSLFDYHAATCNKNRGLDLLMESLGEGREETEKPDQQDMEGIEFQQISLEKFNSIVRSMPVFPT